MSLLSRESKVYGKVKDKGQEGVITKSVVTEKKENGVSNVKKAFASCMGL